MDELEPNVSYVSGNCAGGEEQHEHCDLDVCACACHQAEPSTPIKP